MPKIGDEAFTRAEDFNELTETFSRDKAFFEALTASSSSESFFKSLGFLHWWSKNFTALQDSLLDNVNIFPEKGRKTAREWTLSLTFQLDSDIRCAVYLMSRGLAHQAATNLRASLEHIGVLTHLWTDSEKVFSLKDDHKYWLAFKHEKNKSAKLLLNKKETAKRFAACFWGKEISYLYKWFCSHDVHGGSLIRGVKIEARKTELSCRIFRRMDPNEQQETYKSISDCIALLVTETVHLSTNQGVAPTRIKNLEYDNVLKDSSSYGTAYKALLS